MAGPWRTPGTFTPGQMVDEVDLNREIRDQMNALKNDHFLCNGRLTLTTGVPVTATDVSNSAWLYFTPFKGNRIGLYANGPDLIDNWHVLSFTEIAYPLVLMPDGNYDIFAYADTALWTVALEHVGWLNDNTRATALAMQDGVLVKSTDHSRRYLGTIRIASTFAFDTVTRRWVSNYHNRARRTLRVAESTASWTGQTGTPEYVRASSANQVSLVSGIGDAEVVLNAVLTASNTSPQVTLATGIGENSSVAPATESIQGASHTPVANYNVQLWAYLAKYPTLGYNAYAWLQYSQAAGTTTWLGVSTNILQSGMAGWVEG